MPSVLATLPRQFDLHRPASAPKSWTGEGPSPCAYVASTRTRSAPISGSDVLAPARYR